MKKMLFIAVATLCAFNTTFAQKNDAIQSFFQKYATDDSFTSVFIGPKLFDLASKLDINDPDYKEVSTAVKNVKYISILTKECKNNKNLYAEALQTIDSKTYEPLMTVKSKEDNVQFLVKEKDGVVSELFMAAGTDDEFVLLSMVGDFDLKSIAKLANKVHTKDGGIEIKK
jgi:Domain of unknown function (DUF4252)